MPYFLDFIIPSASAPHKRRVKISRHPMPCCWFSRFLSLFPMAQEKRDNIDAHKLLWYLIKELVKLTRALESGERTSLRMRDVICLLRNRSGLILLYGAWLAEVAFVNGMAP